MQPLIPYNRWQSLSVADVVRLFANAPFSWAIGGGYAVEQFLGVSIRNHSDIDVVIFRDDQLDVQRWLDKWQMYAADPPGTLRPWMRGEYLPYGIHDLWLHQPTISAWQLQIMIAEVDGDEWFSRRDHRIRGPRDQLLAIYNGVPCVRIEIQLLYKAGNLRPKDQRDFEACVPLLDPSARCWLRDALHLVYAEGHPWIDALNQEYT